MEIEQIKAAVKWLDKAKAEVQAIQDVAMDEDNPHGAIVEGVKELLDATKELYESINK